MKVGTGSSFKKWFSRLPPLPFAWSACGQQIAETGTQRALAYLPCEQKQMCNAHCQLQVGGRKGMDGISVSEPSMVARDFSGGDGGDICREGE